MWMSSCASPHFLSRPCNLPWLALLLFFLGQSSRDAELAQSAHPRHHTKFGSRDASFCDERRQGPPRRLFARGDAPLQQRDSRLQQPTVRSQRKGCARGGRRTRLQRVYDDRCGGHACRVCTILTTDVDSNISFLLIYIFIPTRCTTVFC